MRSAGLAAGLMICITTCLLPAARAGDPAQASKAKISEDANNALLQMAKTLLQPEFSFRVQTIRVYEDNKGQPLHIFHTMKVIVHRPDRMAVQVTGDDGSSKLLYDGKTVSIVQPDKNKYASIGAPNNIQAMMHEVMGRLKVDFPLADFLTDAPDKSFLSGVTSGQEVGTVTVDGVPYRHLVFGQPPGIELELWVEKNDQALPRRLIVTYRSLPGQPSFIAQFSDWDFNVHPADSEFAFQPPAGATKVDLKPAETGSTAQGGKR
jgi:hypothetical protein